MRVLSPFRYSCPRSHKSSIASYSTSTPSSPLAGTVAYHRSYVFLHSHKPISEFPSKVNSPLQKALQLSLGRGVGLVNFSWSIDQPVHEKYAGIGDDSHQSEVYCATVFSAARGRLFLPEVSLDNLADVSRRLEEHTSVDERRRATTQSAEKVDKLHLYVCTHGTRDCRCGESGGEVIEALRKEVSSRDLMGRVSISEVAHVGGHKYAANVLVFPFGDWLGTIQAFDISYVMDEILDRTSSSGRAHLTSSPPLCPVFWRGRMGLEKHEQLALHNTLN